jgi:RNA polymerase sigma-70 factor (ECF subfamily)
MAAQSIKTIFFRAITTAVDFEALYQAELPRVYNFFRYRIGDNQSAEDLTAETFEKAWRHRERYRNDMAAFSTWLFTIARRVAQDYYRKQRHNEIPLDEISNISTNELMEDLAQQHVDAARLSVLLARLADRERELVALKYGAGLTNRTIAQLSGLTESNVGVILYRTIQTLRSEWENDHER